MSVNKERIQRQVKAIKRFALAEANRFMANYYDDGLFYKANHYFANAVGKFGVHRLTSMPFHLLQEKIPPIEGIHLEQVNKETQGPNVCYSLRLIMLDPVFPQVTVKNK